MINGIAIRPPEKPGFPSHVQWSGIGGGALLSLPECEWVIERGNKLALELASIGTPTVRQVCPETRCVESQAFDAPDASWLYDRLAQRVAAANRDYFDFDLTGLIEPLQFLRYTPAHEELPDGHYTWHVDHGEGAMATRKLSMVINLSPPSEYDGCRLTLFTERGAFESPYIGQGDAILFPSWTVHSVSPITRGTRYALVAWVHGPRLR